MHPVRMETNLGLAWAFHLWYGCSSMTVVAAEVCAAQEPALRCSWVAGVRNVGGLAFDPSTQEPVVAFTSQQPAPAKGQSAADDILYYQDANDAIDLGDPLCQW